MLSLAAARPTGPWTVKALLRLTQIEYISCDACQVRKWASLRWAGGGGCGGGGGRVVGAVVAGCCGALKGLGWRWKEYQGVKG